MKIYKLLAGYGKYRSIGIDRKYRHDILNLVSSLNDNALLTDWTPPKLVVTKPKLEDAAIPLMFGNAPVFSEHTYQFVNDYLSQWGEFIKCESNFGNYYIFHVLNSISALDLNLSKYTCFPSTSEIDTITQYVFIPELVADQVIFKMSCCINDLFVTDRFDIVFQKFELKGYRLALLAEI